MEDICFIPLKPDNPKCAIMSVLNYFQNSHENLDVKVIMDYFYVKADYINHFTICARQVVLSHIVFA